MPDKVTVVIDGSEYKVAPGRTVLQAALDNGIEIPHFCYHEGLSIAGNCRMCLVEIEGAPKLATSCSERVRDGMVVRTGTEKVLRARAAVLEFLLINHPLDCSVCDKSGECMLQDLTYAHRNFPGDLYIDSRVDKADKLAPATKELSSKIWIWANRCIHCSRCVRFCDEVSGAGELTFVNRGAHTEIDVHPTHPLESDLAVNVVDLCPVGALLDKKFLYQARVWLLDSRKSVCPHCATGCNILIESRRNAVKRIRPRPNAEVNEFWMCDRGRHERGYFDRDDRIRNAEIRNGGRLERRPRKEALESVAERLRGFERGAVAGIGSAQCTCEDNFALRLLVEQLGGAELAVRPTLREEERVFPRFRIEAEKAPNSRGAMLALGLRELGTDSLRAGIEAGRIKAAVALGNELRVPLGESEKAALGRLEFLLVIDSWRSDLAELATVLLPAANYSEKDGTFVSAPGQVQRIRQCLLPEAGEAVSEWIWLKRISDALEGDWEFSSPAGLFESMASAVGAFSGLTYESLGDTGRRLVE